MLNVGEQRPASRQLTRLSGRRTSFGAQRQVTVRQLLDSTIQICSADVLAIVNDREQSVWILSKREELLLAVDAHRETLADVAFFGRPFVSIQAHD